MIKKYQLSLLCILCLPMAVQAYHFKDLWSRPDPQWQGVADYRAQNYSAAASAFAQQDTETANYNRGNALAKAGDYQQALAAYEKALQQNPQDADAKYNRDLVKKLVQKQQQDQPPPSRSKQSNQNKNQDQNKSQQNKDQSADQKNQAKQNQPSQITKTTADPVKAAEQQAQAQQQQATGQWLQSIPDDPGGLLKQKFLRDHERLNPDNGPEDTL